MQRPGHPSDLGDELAKLQRRLNRAKAENEILETLIEEKTRSLYLAQDRIRQSNLYLENVLASMSSAVMITGLDGKVERIGGTTTDLTGRSGVELIGRPLSDIVHTEAPLVGSNGEAATGGEAIEGDVVAQLPDGTEGRTPVLVTSSTLTDDGGAIVGAVFVATDLSDRKQLEIELRHAQRLESIGQLAAGVAHEINTPIQFVSDSARFLGDVLDDLMGLHEAYQPLRGLAATVDGAAEILTEIDEREDEADLDFVRDETPKAVQRTLDGLERVATIVKAMKQFSHPGDDDMAPVDINQLIETTLTVAKNEYKYVADVELELGATADVMCNRGDINQVLINLVVNAAHAIEATRTAAGTDDLGRITIATWEDGDGVGVDITDTGGGIPESISGRVFEPFFTTKEPGKGTGQGLALAHNIVVGKHGGRLDFDSVDGVGTTFHLWLPRKKSG